MFSALHMPKKEAMSSLDIMAMTAAHLDWQCFGFSVTLTQLRRQNTLICSNSIAGDTGKAEGISKAGIFSAVMMPAHILLCFLWILKQPVCHCCLLDRDCLYYLVRIITDQTAWTPSSSPFFSSMSSWIFSRYLQGLAHVWPSCVMMWVVRMEGDPFL